MTNMKTLATVLMLREGHGVDAHRNFRCHFSLLHFHAAVEAGRLHGRSVPRAWCLCTCSDDAVGWCVEGERLHAFRTLSRYAFDESDGDFGAEVARA